MELFEGNLVDLHRREIYPAIVRVENGTISSVDRTDRNYSVYIVPGFVDAHIHIESSMLIPSQFARMAVVHGTVAAVSDPHEIANVLGIAGVEFMIEDAGKVPFTFCFGASPCVPATPFETSGAKLDLADIVQLLGRKEIGYLSEVMNFPAVIAREKEIMARIEAARSAGKVVDGHAPGVRGEELQKYIDAGISTDHESATCEEAREKLQRGMKILIREGSAARNFEALCDLIPEYPDRLMFCSDDRHPDDLARGHINTLVSRAVAKGYDLFDVLRIASLNPVEHYGLRTGLLRPGDRADFIMVRDLKNFRVLKTVTGGRVVAAEGRSLIKSHSLKNMPNNFSATKKSPDDFRIEGACESVEVIEAVDRELVTGESRVSLESADGDLQTDLSRDILKIAVVNRYDPKARPSVAFVRNFGLKRGAIASSVAHDSHNIIAVGCDNDSLADAVNEVISSRGGISAVYGDERRLLPLPVAGLMSDLDGGKVAKAYREIDRFAKERLGSTLSAPFMTLSFMALPVIPAVKLSDRGLFDGRAFHFIPVCTQKE